jgi:tetratricopeptide (TPR) repeat protein
MPSHTNLVVTADTHTRSAEFRLLDTNGGQIAYRQTDFTAVAAARQQALFDLRNYLRHYVQPEDQTATFAQVGVCIANEVLGEEIFRKLWESHSQRTLRIQLPNAREGENRLAAALARIPWEIARPAIDRPTLAERNMLVRIVHGTTDAPLEPLVFAKEECLRVLFIFGEAPGSRPLAARIERLALQHLFRQEIYPKRRVVAHFLTHGVTRERLEAQIQENGGYHIVHWSGHGQPNHLDLCKPGGEKDRLSGEELLEIFVRAGGFIPRLFFLGACHSGDILQVDNWLAFLAAAQNRSSQTVDAANERTTDILIEEEPGFTGTAHTLLGGGVTSVVAMRYAVGDAYASALGIEFYRALLAHPAPKPVAAALTMARQALKDKSKHDTARFAIADHATPLLYGSEQPALSLPQGRSPLLSERIRRLPPIAELSAAGQEYFVGRTWELAGLGANFIGSGYGSQEKPIALITGLGGMGKTALAAETLALWESRFEWLLLFQAKPNVLTLEGMLRDVHIRLSGELGLYREHVTTHEADAVYRAASADFTGQDRLHRLISNLVRALRDEPILLVFDNFETNLKPQPENPAVRANEVRWACQDPNWDHCLASLARELPGSSSRILITCRHPLAAVPSNACHWVLLGPLPAGEAALYLREHPALSKMAFGDDPQQKKLALRLLNASRFHPLLMDRLARLATGDQASLAKLIEAIETLEKSRDFEQLPALFADNRSDDPTEIAYLNDALAASLTQLLNDVSLDARRLLWMIGLANEPVSLSLLEGAWSGESIEDHRLRRAKEAIARSRELPQALQKRVDAMPSTLREKLYASPSVPSRQHDLKNILRQLVTVGLATEKSNGPNGSELRYTCHELVRERINEWMSDHPSDRPDLTDHAIRIAFGGRLELECTILMHKHMDAALDAGSRALVYYLQAGAYDQLSIASDILTENNAPHIAERLIPYLEEAVSAAPAGSAHWTCLTHLADAINSADRMDDCLPLYEQAACEARSAAKATNSAQDWQDLSLINDGWARALYKLGKLDAARERRQENASVDVKANAREVSVMMNEIECLRIDVMQGRGDEVLPQLKSYLSKLEGWWAQYFEGEAGPEVRDLEDLARTFLGALDVVRKAYFAQEEWKSAVRVIETTIGVKQQLGRTREDIARDRLNLGNVLQQLNRFKDAKREFDHCLEVFEHDDTEKARVLSSLATLFFLQDDGPAAILQVRRALAIREQLPGIRDRALSHANLATYLDAQSGVSAEANRHRLAAIVYQIEAKLSQDLQKSLLIHARCLRLHRQANTSMKVPRMADLLADPAFASLSSWLQQASINVTELQTSVDRHLELARRVSLTSN